MTNSSLDSYSTEEAYTENGVHMGDISPQKLRQIIRTHTDVCRVFRTMVGEGYHHSMTVDDAYSPAEHSGRIEADTQLAIDKLADDCSRCFIRLDTSEPQLAFVDNGSVRLELEFDDSAVRFTPPTNSLSGDSSQQVDTELK